MTNPWRNAQSVFQKALDGLRARVPGSDGESTFEPLALGLLAGANVVIGATRETFAVARALAQAMADLIDSQAGPAFTLTEAISRRHTGSSLVGDIAFTWGKTSYNVPSAIPQGVRIIILDDLSRLTPGPLDALARGWLGEEDCGVREAREFRRLLGEQIELSHLLAVVAVIDTDRPLRPDGKPYSDKFAHFFDIGVSFTAHRSAGTARGDGAIGHHSHVDDAVTLSTSAIADFRAAAKDVAFEIDERSSELLIRAIRPMPIGAHGAYLRHRDIVQALAAAHGRDTADENDWLQAITLRQHAFAALYNRRPDL